MTMRGRPRNDKEGDALHNDGKGSPRNNGEGWTIAMMSLETQGSQDFHFRHHEACEASRSDLLVGWKEKKRLLRFARNDGVV